MCVDNFIFVRVDGTQDLYTWVSDKLRDSLYHNFGMTVSLQSVHLEIAEALGEALVGYAPIQMKTDSHRPKPPPEVDLFEVAYHYLRGGMPEPGANRIGAARVLQTALESVNKYKALELAQVYCSKAIELLGTNKYSSLLIYRSSLQYREGCGHMGSGTSTLLGCLHYSAGLRESAW